MPEVLTDTRAKINRSLYRKLVSIVPETSSEQEDTRAHFQHPHTWHHVAVEIYQSRYLLDDSYKPFIQIPAILSLPIVSFEEWEQGRPTHDKLKSTPYRRILPTFVIGADGVLHSFQNIYLFDELGNGINIQQVCDWNVDPDYEDLDDAIFSFGLGRTHLLTLKFTPSETDTRAVRLKTRDHKKIRQLLTQIQEEPWFRKSYDFT